MSLETIMAAINQFRDERDWRQNHNEKDLALSVVLEAAELLEIYQWKTPAEGNQAREHLEEEIADVLIYTFMLADNLDMDIEDIIMKKLAKNAEKYPIEASYGAKGRYYKAEQEEKRRQEEKRAKQREKEQAEDAEALNEMRKLFGNKIN